MMAGALSSLVISSSDFFTFLLLAYWRRFEKLPDPLDHPFNNCIVGRLSISQKNLERYDDNSYVVG
jgi:hypothetical protein